LDPGIPRARPEPRSRSLAHMSPSLRAVGPCAALLAVASHLSGCAVEKSPESLEGETTASTTGGAPGTTSSAFLGTTAEAETTGAPGATGTSAETTTAADATGPFPGTGHEECKDDDAALVEWIDDNNLTEWILSEFDVAVTDCGVVTDIGGCSGSEDVAQICCATCEACEDDDAALVEWIDANNLTEEMLSEFNFTVTDCGVVAGIGGCGSEDVAHMCCATCEAYYYYYYEDSASESCSSHASCGAGEFCFDGGCSSCDECHFCDDGVDGTCGSCGDGFPTMEDGPCTAGEAETTADP